MTMETVGAIRRDQGRTISAATSSPTRERASVKPIRDRFGSRSPNCAVLKEQPQRAPTWPRDVPILLRTVAARLEDEMPECDGFVARRDMAEPFV
jgi:hypothetical protein